MSAAPRALLRHGIAPPAPAPPEYAAGTRRDARRRDDHALPRRAAARARPVPDRSTRTASAIDAGRETVALCRCGKSRLRPFCDGTHKLVRFKAPSGGRERARRARPRGRSPSGAAPRRAQRGARRRPRRRAAAAPSGRRARRARGRPRGCRPRARARWRASPPARSTAAIVLVHGVGLDVLVEELGRAASSKPSRRRPSA